MPLLPVSTVPRDVARVCTVGAPCASAPRVPAGRLDQSSASPAMRMNAIPLAPEKTIRPRITLNLPCNSKGYRGEEGQAAGCVRRDPPASAGGRLGDEILGFAP